MKRPAHAGFFMRAPVQSPRRAQQCGGNVMLTEGFAAGIKLQPERAWLRS